MSKLGRLASLGLIAVCACTHRNPSSVAPSLVPLPHDDHSYAQLDEARVTHVSLDLTPNFSSQRIAGKARLNFERSSSADSIVLDVRDLTIKSVTDSRGQVLGYRIGASDPILGSPFAIALASTDNTLVIDYETSPEAAAVQWLTAAQTAGRKMPFLFTQGEAILTRTWIPTQDSPGQRQTYDATIHVPEGMRAVMSAEHVGPDGVKGPRGLVAYRFRMEHPIPPYLIALSVGDLAFRAIGIRTGVYAEPTVVDKAASEFGEVDQMIAAAEKLFGPYRWGRYDVLVLPPSFPYGGMENPTLTFATPTVLAGDRSLVSLIAHELAHSWSGNLVTNSTWNDFWLNEGFTVYLENRIMEELRGRRYTDMLRVLGRQDMQKAVVDAGGLSAPDTRLRLDLKGRDPDEATGNIAYEKGNAFLETVESVVGRPRLDAFLRDYFAHFSFQPMSSERMLNYMRVKLLRGDEERRIGVQQWVYEPGIPANIPAVSSEAFAAVDLAVTAWKTGTAPASLQTASWSTQERLHFLRALPNTISSDQLTGLDRAFRLTQSGNSEILFAWFQIAIRNRYEPAFAALEHYLTSQGRRKLVAPLYADLAKSDWGRTLAVRIYRQARPTYHSVAVNTIDKTLNWSEQK